MLKEKLISINEAARLGIDRIRKPEWATPEDHLKIDIFDEHHGPWFHLYAPFNKECNGRDPVDVICVHMNVTEKVWLPYKGPHPDSNEYKAACARYEGVLGNNPAPPNV